MRLPAVEASVMTSLGLPLILTRADADTRTSLSASEYRYLSAIRGERRKRDWLLGRNALKQVLAVLSGDDDTSDITFPNPRVSLTHSRGVALAVGTRCPGAGIGIDYEATRDINPKIAGLFLNDSEVEWFKQQAVSVSTKELLRLWTIKEAAFKCYPHNAGMLLSDFTVIAMDAERIEVGVKGQAGRIEVACCAYDSGWLSVAVFGWKLSWTVNSVAPTPLMYVSPRESSS